MDGWPVWLASVSTWKFGRLVSFGDLLPRERERAIAVAFNALAGVGDHSRERVFRMCVTLCVHRAVSDAEMATIGTPSCPTVNIAGGPVEILSSKGCSTSPSCLPCENFSRKRIDPTRADLWVPVDCGECEPCRARALIEAGA